MSILQQIHTSLIDQKELSVLLKRDDLIHPDFGGNKWRKLKYNLGQARAESKTTVLSFGGQHSNHLYALAAAGLYFGFKTIGLVRGNPPEKLNATLRFLKRRGMRLEFIGWADYRRRHEHSYWDELREKFGPKIYIIPEGGTNALALKGVAELVDEVEARNRYWAVSSGTGGTAAGILYGLVRDHREEKVLVFPALKGDFMEKQIVTLLDKAGVDSQEADWRIIPDYHFGGFAKYDLELVQFINQFKTQQAIPLDPIYTGKMLFGLFDLIRKDFFPKGTQIIAVHTGGLQGIRGFNERFGNLLI